MYDMFRAVFENHTILDERMSHFKTNGRETKTSKDKCQLLHIFTDILESFSFSTQHVC